MGNSKLLPTWLLRSEEFLVTQKLGSDHQQQIFKFQVNLPIQLDLNSQVRLSFCVESDSSTRRHSPQRELHSTLLTFKAFSEAFRDD